MLNIVLGGSTGWTAAFLETPPVEALLSMVPETYKKYGLDPKVIIMGFVSGLRNGVAFQGDSLNEQE